MNDREIVRLELALDIYEDLIQEAMDKGVTLDDIINWTLKEGLLPFYREKELWEE